MKARRAVTVPFELSVYDPEVVGDESFIEYEAYVDVEVACDVHGEDADGNRGMRDVYLNGVDILEVRNLENETLVDNKDVTEEMEAAIADRLETMLCDGQLDMDDDD